MMLSCDGRLSISSIVSWLIWKTAIPHCHIEVEGNVLVSEQVVFVVS